MSDRIARQTQLALWDPAAGGRGHPQPLRPKAYAARAAFANGELGLAVDLDDDGEDRDDRAFARGGEGGLRALEACERLQVTSRGKDELELSALGALERILRACPDVVRGLDPVVKRELPQRCQCREEDGVEATRHVLGRDPVCVRREQVGCEVEVFPLDQLVEG